MIFFEVDVYIGKSISEMVIWYSMEHFVFFILMTILKYDNVLNS